jgi:hypothetical protein
MWLNGRAIGQCAVKRVTLMRCSPMGKMSKDTKAFWKLFGLWRDAIT